MDCPSYMETSLIPGVNLPLEKFSTEPLFRDTSFKTQIPFPVGVALTRDWLKNRRTDMLQKFEFRSTLIPGLIEIIPFKADDSRGAFIKDYSKEVFEKNGISHDLSEVFYTVSHRGVVRALHFQREYQQPKLVRCISGKIYDVVVDLRKNSPTFKQFVSFFVRRRWEEGNSGSSGLCPRLFSFRAFNC